MKRIYCLFLISIFFSLSLEAQEKFNNCGMYGNARAESVKKLNSEKNRYTFPTEKDIDRSITLAEILEEENDEIKFSNSKAAEIVAYVYAVKKGGIETCNCKAKEDQFRDTQIELIFDPNRSEKTRRMIVEVTPRLRAKMKERGVDWSTGALKRKFLHKWVKVKGWMLFDVEHLHNARNTNPYGDNIWRATAWEIHPVTSIELIKQP